MNNTKLNVLCNMISAVFLSFYNVLRLPVEALIDVNKVHVDQYHRKYIASSNLSVPVCQFKSFSFPFPFLSFQRNDCV